MRDLTRERYYEDRAPVYDATSYRGDPRINAGLDRETAEIGARLTALSAGRVLEVGCGTAVWTQFLRGTVVAMDQSAAMLEIARTRVPEAMLIRALVPPMPFVDDSFDRVFTANFYGLLRAPERALFLADVSRVARELVVVDLRSDDDASMEGIEERSIGTDVTYRIFRRRFTPRSLCDELGGELMYSGRYFLAVRVMLAPVASPP
jgi:ubiquinone/menaquinone biosynthesis C-methylase UbiE